MNCPKCESNNVVSSDVPHVIPVPRPNGKAEYTSAVLPVLSCRDCGQTWMDWCGEQVKDAAVRKHLAKERR